jgi:thiamine biosynthesis lipoprotein
MRQHRIIMGMPVQLEIVDSTATQAHYDAIFAYLISIDDRFSTYKSDSEISRVNRNEIRPEQYSPELREVLERSEKTKEDTGGYFDIKTPQGTLDPSGLVKGWAINSAAEMLLRDGFKDFYIEIAGDLQTHGVNSEGKEWSIGIRNPSSRDEVVKVLYPHGKGVATSGTYIRGNHIYTPIAVDESPSEYVSLPVIGPNIYEADRFATAAFAMGAKGIHFLESRSGFEAYAIDHKGIATMTTGFDTYTTI